MPITFIADRFHVDGDVTADDDAEMLDAPPLMTQHGIDTLTGVIGHNVSRHGSDCDAALLPDRKRLSTKFLEDAAWQKMALDVEGVLDGSVDRQETLG